MACHKRSDVRSKDDRVIAAQALIGHRLDILALGDDGATVLGSTCAAAGLAEALLSSSVRSAAFGVAENYVGQPPSASFGARQGRLSDRPSPAGAGRCIGQESLESGP